MIPITNYPFEYYPYSAPYHHQIPFNFMNINPPFYAFYDCNPGVRNRYLHSSQEGPEVPLRDQMTKVVHVLKRE